MATEIKALFKVSGPDLKIDEVTVGRQGFRVGRLSENTLALNHREISRQHMRITWREDEKFLVEDLNSSNGVWLNDTRLVARAPEEINEGDVIRCGPFIFTFVRLIQYEPEILDRPSAAAFDVSLGAVEKSPNGYPPGIPRGQSNWLQYLPAIFSDDEFMGRYLLIFESIMSPLVWMIDNFDLYLAPETAPQAWLQWMANWFDLLLLPELPIDRQREIMRQAGWLFLRRGTPSGLHRLLELYFGVTPEIIEDEPCHFVVRLPLSESHVTLGAEVADRLINSQKPAFASYILEVT
jgi:phage tail-like protein